MEIETNKYRIVDDKSQTIEENLSIEEANYLLDFLRFPYFSMDSHHRSGMDLLRMQEIHACKAIFNGSRR